MAWVIAPGLLLLGGPTSLARDYSSLKIIPPPGGGMYIGQHERVPGDTADFEKAIGKKAAWGSPLEVHEVSNLAGALEKRWQQNKITVVPVIEAVPVPDNRIPGLTVDKLLKGAYDSELRSIAVQLRKFGKAVFVEVAREPNGIDFNYMGGFGPKGDKTLKWAIENKKGLAEFNPSEFPNKALYAGLGDPNVCDGVERLIAAHRYAYDFLVRKEGLKFLTFETMGWDTSGSMVEKLTVGDLKAIVVEEFRISPASVSPAHLRTLVRSCQNFEHFYPGDAYVDWVSINWYMLGGRETPIKLHLEKLALAMAKIRKVASNKPVLIMEMGFPDDTKKDSSWAAQKVTAGLNELITKYPEIGGFSMWGATPSGEPGPDFRVRPNTSQGRAFKAVIDANPSKFHSCVYFSDGSRMPNCEPRR